MLIRINSYFWDLDYKKLSIIIKRFLYLLRGVGGSFSEMLNTVIIGGPILKIFLI